MSKKPETVLLRNLDTQKSEPFAPDHAERLLAYPGTRFAAIAEGESEPKKKSVGAAASSPAPAADATGQPNAI